MTVLRRSVVAGALAMTAAGGARAQQWPSRTIRMICPYAPGATGDIGGRLYSEELSKALGQSVVVDNKTGAGGTIATAEMARAAPDGHTLGVMAQGTLVYNMGLYKTPGYDPFKDLVVLSINFSVANVLIVHPSNPAKTVADVVEQARAK
jgi:tripartite-type tricarboxylate transporter receptor subunit TctC